VFTGLALPIVLVRVLSPADFGLYKQLFVVALTVSSFAQCGITTSLLFLVPRHPGLVRRLERQAFTGVCVSGVLSALVILSGALPVSLGLANVTRWQMGCLAIIVMAIQPASLMMSLPIAEGNGRLAAAILTITELVRTVVLLFSALLFRSVDAVVAAAALLLVVQMAVGWALVARHASPRESPPPLQKTVRLHAEVAIPTGIASVIGYSRDQAHAVYMIGQLTAVQYALYAVGTTTVPFIGQIQQTIGEIVAREATTAIAKQDLALALRRWHQGLRVQALLLAPAFAFLMFFASDFITLLFGTTYAAAASLFRVFLLFLPLSVASFTVNLIRAAGANRTVLLADVSSLTVTLSCLIPLTDHLGPQGALISQLLGLVTYGVVGALLLRRELGLTCFQVFPPRLLLAGYFLSLPIAGAVWMVVGPLSIVVRLAVGAAAFGGLYLALAIAFGLIEDEERIWLVRQGKAALERLSSAPRAKGR
jgi:O-antigen/teichoic acid export membrane protein